VNYAGASYTHASEVHGVQRGPQRVVLAFSMLRNKRTHIPRLESLSQFLTSSFTGAPMTHQSSSLMLASMTVR